jgi:hypothetical protein
MFYSVLNVHRHQNKTDENRKALVEARSAYKFCIRKNRYNYSYAKKKLENCRLKNAKMY